VLFAAAHSREHEHGGHHVQWDSNGGTVSVGCVAFLVAVQTVGGPTLRCPSRVSGRKAARRSLGSTGGKGGGRRFITTFTKALGFEMAKICCPRCRNIAFGRTGIVATLFALVV